MNLRIKLSLTKIIDAVECAVLSRLLVILKGQLAEELRFFFVPDKNYF